MFLNYFLYFKIWLSHISAEMFATSRISALISVLRVDSANPDISRNFRLAI